MKPEIMKEAIALSVQNVRDGTGGPFAAIIVKNGEVVARGANCVTSQNDPTAHAEVMAIRNACQKLNTFNLQGCEIYATCEPCPMCLAAIYWSRIDRLYYANTREDAAAIGFDDLFLYQEINRPPAKRTIRSIQMMRDEALIAFEEWKKKADKIRY